MPSRLARIAVLTTLAVMLSSASAGAAGTVTVDVFGLDYVGDDGVNVVTFTDAPQGMDVRVFINEAGITAGTGCMPMGANDAYCDIDDFDGVRAVFKGGNDVATSNGTLTRYSLLGDAGEDTLTGSNAVEATFSTGDSLQGGADRDTLIGRDGDDTLYGEAGDGDVLEGGPGDDSLGLDDGSGTGDVLHGGPGFDLLFGFYSGPDPPQGVTADLAAGTVSVVAASATFDGIEDLDGDDGPDVLLGNAGANVIDGEEGNDVIDGRGGPDRLDGGEDDDRLEGRDGAVDSMDGGFGTDTCDADQLDTREACEAGALVQLPPFGTPPPPDRMGPACVMRGVAGKVARGSVLKRGLVVRATCDESGRVSARLLGTLRRLGGASASRAGDVELAVRSAPVTAERTRRLRLRVGKGVRVLLRRGARLRIELTARDALGNERVSVKRLRLK